jgi:hypothetical protein
VKLNPLRKIIHLVSFVAIAMAGSGIASANKVGEAADAPYENLLIIFLSSSFDSRRYLETEIVKELEKKGTKAVRSTSMMDSRVPLKKETFRKMVEEIGADAVLVTQLADAKVQGEVVDMSPQATYNVRPTYWFNVWSVELTEYVEPQGVNYDSEFVLATQLYSVQSQDVVWATETSSTIHRGFDAGPDYSIYVKEAHDIVKALRKDRLIAR